MCLSREETHDGLIEIKNKCKLWISSIPSRKAREKFTVTPYDKKADDFHTQVLHLL